MEVRPRRPPRQGGGTWELQSRVFLARFVGLCGDLVNFDPSCTANLASVWLAPPPWVVESRPASFTLKRMDIDSGVRGSLRPPLLIHGRLIVKNKRETSPKT